MKKNTNKEDKICFILNTITSIIFLITGILNLVTEGVNVWNGITNIALSVTFGSLAYMYFKKYNAEK